MIIERNYECYLLIRHYMLNKVDNILTKDKNDNDKCQIKYSH